MLNRSWWVRFVILSVFVVAAFVHVFPTLAQIDLEKTKFPFKKKVNLGLDLQGGLYMVYSVDFKKVYRDVLVRAAEGLNNELGKEGASLGLGEMDSSMLEDPKLAVTLNGISLEALKEKVKKSYYTLRIMENGPKVSLAIARDYRLDLKEKTLKQSVQVVRNRIDEFGVAEPSITTKGENQIVVELPGVREVERAKALVGRTARLEFKIANDQAMDPAAVAGIVSQVEQKNGVKFKEGQKFSEYLDQINKFAKSQIPAGSEIAFERIQNQNVPYLLFSKVEISGDDLQDAHVGYDQQNMRPIVQFQMNPRGALTFAEVTQRNVGKRMAIVLDGIVHSAPVINEKIPGGSGQITLGGGQDVMKEAADLAIVLRAGALPAPLELQEQRVIGPSLGADSIAAGLKAGVIGSLLVFVFMTIYYRLSGVVAVASLLLNLVFMLAILIGMDATLTLPGIAGLALTIGMAVDSNVIIFERIRDELIDGRPVAAAVQAGFDKAFTVIFDANITHGIVGFILLNFGTGPVRGFAITLIIGIVTTVFCATTFSKLVFDFWLSRHDGKLEKLSI